MLLCQSCAALFCPLIRHNFWLCFSAYISMIQLMRIVLRGAQPVGTGRAPRSITKVKTEVWVCSAEVAGALQGCKGDLLLLGTCHKHEQLRQEGLQWAHVYFNAACFSAQTTPWMILGSSADSKEAFLCKQHLHGGEHHEPLLPLCHFLIIDNVKLCVAASPCRWQTHVCTTSTFYSSDQ